MGKFLAPRPKIEEVFSWVHKKWVLKGQVEVVSMAKGFFSFSFSCDEDLRLVFSKAPRVFGHLTLVLHPWDPGMDLSKFMFHFAPIWLKLPNLLLEYWDEEVFKVVANYFGHLVSIDEATLFGRCMVASKLCVMIDHGAQVPNFFHLNLKVGSWKQYVVFEFFPIVCFKCKNLGH